jgi:hypothetical protein
MASRAWLTIPEGELADIEDAAREASKAVAHLHTPIDYRTWPCGHRRSTTCAYDRCTLVTSPFMCT